MFCKLTDSKTIQHNKYFNYAYQFS